MSGRAAVLVVYLALSAAVASVAWLAPAAAQAEPVTVQLDSGPAIGNQTADILALKGVPYAAAPTGDLRWRPPQPVAAWHEARSATDYGASCPQRRPPRFVVPGSTAATLSENCLFLNAWAPAGGKSAPVVVWIHGGGNVSGTASQTFYDGAAFARDGIVFVSFNYRLGLLGFFAHPALTADSTSPSGAMHDANFALMDQIAALQWVHRNIRALGGDPDKVTVMGESAGGEDILNLMTIPAAKGLFARAIVESAALGWADAPTLEEAQSNGVGIAAALGLAEKESRAGAAALRGVAPEALLRVQADREIGPIVDRSLLERPVLKSFAMGQAAPVPLLIGSNSDEGSLLGPDLAPQSLFPRLTAERRAALRGAYGALAPDDHAFAKLLLRDGYFASPARWIADRQARAAPVYLYRFDYVASLFRDRRPGASHGSEIPFVFETGEFSRWSADDTRVSTAMHACWTAFIKAGAPACGDAAWPRYDAARDEMMIFAALPAVAKTPNADILNRLRDWLER
jgi:para-nitrobenzyl esterase